MVCLDGLPLSVRLKGAGRTQTSTAALKDARSDVPGADGAGGGGAAAVAAAGDAEGGAAAAASDGK